MQVFCDFDGTIARLDTTDLVLRHYARAEWETVEDAWTQGRISAAQCMREQVALVEADAAMLDDLLDTVPLDGGFVEFARWCAATATPLSVVSDGADGFIRRILSRYNLGHLPVVANRLVPQGARGWALEQPFAMAGCTAGSGVCKCAATGLGRGRTNGDYAVFVGDGRSDCCVAEHADLVFARDKLAAHLAARDLPFTPFSSFHEITATLSAMTRDRRPLRTVAARG